MEALSKSGKILHGKIAEILVRKGSATPLEGSEVEARKAEALKKKAAAKKAPKKEVKKAPKKAKK
jgi:hypothetical protein